MRFCGACGSPLADAVAHSTDGGGASVARRRHLTVLFSDLVGSTPLAEQLDPEDFRDLLSGYHEACARAILLFNGYVAQYQGDGVVAYFGYPRAHEDDAYRAVRASLEILSEVDLLNERLQDTFGISLAVRIGLHTGMVVAGEMGGGPLHERHSAVGDTLHIAARVQTVAPPGSVVVTDSTLALVAGHFQTEDLGAKELKGISRPVSVFRVQPPHGHGAMAEQPRPTARTPLVDRVEEMGRLREAWESARAADGVVVHLAGEAGIGKTRLVHALREQVREQAGSEHILQCSPHHSATELYPAIRFVETMAELDRTRTPEVQVEALERFVCGRGLDAQEAVPVLAELLTIPVREAIPIAEARPHDARSATLQVLQRLLSPDSAEDPLLLVVEDLHWSDPTTLELLERFVSDPERRSVACVVTFRPDFQPPWTQWQATVDVDLGPLSHSHVRTLAAAVGGETLDDTALARVELAAEGVPLFVEEMAKSISTLEHKQLPDSQVPSTLQGLLTERLDRLPELAGLIDVAAVLGREFDRGVLETLSELDRMTLRSALAQLTAEEVLRPVEGSRTRLEFRHALLQEVAYERLLRRRRRALHAQVAEVLSSHRPSAWESEPEQIAHHWTCAEEPARAFPYWERAGRRALRRAAFVEAAAHFRQAVKALDATRPAPDAELERAELLTALGAALQAGVTPGASVDVIYADARHSFANVGEPHRLIPVIYGEYLFHMTRAQHSQALELAEEMLALGRERRAGVVALRGLLLPGLWADDAWRAGGCKCGTRSRDRSLQPDTQPR